MSMETEAPPANGSVPALREQMAMVKFSGPLSGDPEEVIEKATKIATSLHQIIKRAELAVQIGKNAYVKCEGWTTMAAMLGVFPRTDWTRPVEDGWEARVSLVHIATGREISAAEAMCVPGEERWDDAEEHSLRSMAQTRATSKACRIALSWIMVLAGYSATPADEVTRKMRDKESAERPSEATATKTESADGPFYREATPIECRDLFQGPEDKDGRAGRNKKTKDLPKGCRYRVEDVKGEKDRKGEQKKSYTPEVDAMIYGGDSRSEPVQVAGPKPEPVVPETNPAAVVQTAPMGALNGDKLDREIALEIRSKGWTPARVQVVANRLGAPAGEWTKADESIKMRLLSALCDTVAAK